MESSTGSAEKVVENGPSTEGKGRVHRLFSALTKPLCNGLKSLKTIRFGRSFSFLYEPRRGAWRSFPQNGG
jgi:hypothetical protein